MIIAGIASLPERVESLKDTVDSLLPQVDEIHLYLAEGHTYHKHQQALSKNVLWHWPQEDMGDAGKFWPFYAYQGQNAYFFTCDDDLIYPPDYVEKTIAGIEKYDRKAIVGYHGVTLKKQVHHYYRDRKVYHGLETVKEDLAVDVIGTCSMAWHSSTIELRYEDFEVPNIADIWVACWAQEQKVPIVCLAHEKGWIKYNHDKMGKNDTLFDSFHRDKSYPGNAILKRYGVNQWPKPRLL
jgi:hypothetical protein